MAEQLDFSDAYNDVMLEFLEVAIHQVLFVRRVYPPGFFDKRQKYGIIVQMCNQKLLNDYIKNVLDGIGVLLRKDAVQKVELLILEQKKPVESFVFAVSKQNNSIIMEKGVELEKLKQHLKGSFLRIALSASMIGEPSSSEDMTFELKVHALSNAVSELEGTANFNVFPWMSADTPQSNPPTTQPQIVPLKSLTSSLLTVRMTE
jgi:mitotic spindle assembly checkpoint protein MAD2B